MEPTLTPRRFTAREAWSILSNASKAMRVFVRLKEGQQGSG